MQSDGPPSANNGPAGPSNQHQMHGDTRGNGVSGNAQTSENVGTLAGSSGDTAAWYGGQMPSAGQFSYPREYPLAPDHYSNSSYPFQPQQSQQAPPPPLPQNLPQQYHHPEQYTPQHQPYPPAPSQPNTEPYNPFSLDGRFQQSPNWGLSTAPPPASGEPDYQQFSQFGPSSYALSALALEVRPPPINMVPSQTYTNAAPNASIESSSAATQAITSPPPKRPPRASKRRRGGSAAAAPASRSSELAGPWSVAQNNNHNQNDPSSSVSPGTTWPDGSSTASFSGSFDLSLYKDGNMESASLVGQRPATAGGTSMTMDPSSDNNALSRSKQANREKRKGEAGAIATEDEDDGSIEGQDDGSAGASRLDKRRNQNKLAQRAFRARTKVQNVEVHSQIAHLMEVTESQNRRLEEMTALVASLQKENLELRMSSVNTGPPAGQQADSSGPSGQSGQSWNRNQTDQKPS